ncbi:MAG: hypothetical protein KDB07_10375 [Planctomycetes bacterium]|nr:hypothetical protein [Planctomycetota bacterium]
MASTKTNPESPELAARRKELLAYWRSLKPKNDWERKSIQAKIAQLESGAELLSDEDFERFLEDIAG